MSNIVLRTIPALSIPSQKNTLKFFVIQGFDEDKNNLNFCFRLSLVL
jgi:hypothetical protein